MGFAQCRSLRTPDGEKLESGWMYVWVGKLLIERRRVEEDTDGKEVLKREGESAPVECVLGSGFSQVYGWVKGCSSSRCRGDHPGDRQCVTVASEGLAGLSFETPSEGNLIKGK